ncbi:MAG: hypothetical protein HQK77_11615 [Desulfobacterales bacterium]|nr:hypothetical protein [Desulfobacterales bacterium]
MKTMNRKFVIFSLFLLQTIFLIFIGCTGNENVHDLRKAKLSIRSPQNGTTYPEGSYITFSATMYDDSGNPATATDYSWASSIDGVLSDPAATAATAAAGTGTTTTTPNESFSLNGLSEGVHTITVSAKNSAGVRFSDSVKITVGGATYASKNNLPTVTIDNPKEGNVFSIGDFITFNGSATDKEDGSLSGKALSWTSSKDGFLGTGASLIIDTGGLPMSEGSHTIVLTATDSNGAAATSASITIKVGNVPPTAEIVSPEDASIFDTGDSITFSGTGYDPEDGALEKYFPINDYLIWTSSKDGPIGVGTGFTVPLSSLSNGTHIITLTAKDTKGATGTDSIKITIGNEPPIAEIIFPAATSGLTYDVNNTIVFDGIGTDKEDGKLTGKSLVWTSSIDGVISTGTRVETNTLSQGVHEIILTATDSDGATGTDSITITVGNSPPRVTIISPKDKTKFEYGNSSTMDLILDGQAVDDRDGVLPGSSFTWYSSLDGSITTPVGTGAGTSVVLHNPSVGKHIITLTAMDSDFATGTASINIEVK